MVGLFLLLLIPTDQALIGKIVDVEDGDTVKVEIATKESGNIAFKLRLLAVDCPELEHAWKAQPFSSEAKAYTERLKGQKVKFLWRETDIHGRFVGRLYYGKDYSNYLNQELVENGLAWVDIRYGRKADREPLIKGMIDAKAKRINLWSRDAIAPWVWRSK